MRIVSLIALIVLSGVFAVATICVPEFLGENPFLLGFVTHEYINVLIVIVTVSFVSVTQIHLEYSRVERSFGLRAFGEARREVNFGAVLLLALLLLSVVLVVFKSANADNVTFQSAMHSAALVMLVASILVMYDFVRTVYVLAANEPIEGEDDESEEGTG